MDGAWTLTPQCLVLTPTATWDMSPEVLRTTILETTLPMQRRRILLVPEHWSRVVEGGLGRESLV